MNRESSARPLVSILINNYNYARFLRAAIESTLCQSYTPVEVIVVDDGSTDQSRKVIESFGSRLFPVFQANAGQASAFNAGVACSRGDILCFLDSDDCFYPEKVARIVETFSALERTRPLMVHHRLKIRQENGGAAREEFLGRMHDNPLNLAEYARKYKFMYWPTGPTTGISINRRMSDLLFPLPAGIRVSADDFIVYGASLVGELHCVSDVLGVYRLHGNNNWYYGAKSKSVEFRAALDGYLNQKLKENGLPGRISYEESMCSWWEIARDKQWADLVWRVLKANVVQHDLHTLEVSYVQCVIPAGRHVFRKMFPSVLNAFKSTKLHRRSS
jgi:glycosyltransferase involved in cell wall biosynthesis